MRFVSYCMKCGRRFLTNPEVCPECRVRMKRRLEPSPKNSPPESYRSTFYTDEAEEFGG